MEPDQVLKVAILGLGRWGIHLVRNFLAHPHVQVVAIADSNRERLQAVAQEFGLSSRVICSADWRVALAVQGLDAVAIATPASTHATLIRAALEQRCHVLAEKPLSLSVVEAVALCRLAEQQQRQLIVDYTYLFHPAVNRGQQVIQADFLGELRYGYASRTHLGPVRADVDALWDLAIHDLTIFNRWLAEMPCRVQAQGTVWLQPNSRILAAEGVEAQADSKTPPKTQLDTQIGRGLADLVWVKLLYPSGFQAFIHLCWANADKQRRLSVVGDRGTLIFDELAAYPLTLQTGQLEYSAQAASPRWAPINVSQKILEVEPLEPLWQVCDHFVSCARYNRPSEISLGWMGVQLVGVLEGLTRSLHNNGAIVQIEAYSHETKLPQC